MPVLAARVNQITRPMRRESPAWSPEASCEAEAGNSTSANGENTARGVGITPDPKAARSVVIGLDRGFTYERLDRAAIAVRHGARLIATNTDATFPTPEGPAPGAGALVAALEAATGIKAQVAGKPHPAMISAVSHLLVPGPVWVVGDRPETDLALGAAAGWGRIVNLSAGSADLRNHSIYTLAKSAIVTLTETLANELAPEILVNCVSPGQIAESADDIAEFDPSFVERATATTPLGRLVTRPEVAALVAELCGPLFAGVTGVTIPVDGGWRLRSF